MNRRRKLVIALGAGALIAPFGSLAQQGRVWRVGYLAAPQAVIENALKAGQNSITCVAPFVQKAAVEALGTCSMEVERMRQEFERRRNAIVYRLRAIPGVSCPEPRGAFYAFPNVARYLDKEFAGASMRNTYGLGYYLLKEAQVAVIPGQAFGSEEHIRLSFALSMERIEEGMRRVARALARLETIQYSVEKVITAEIGQGNFGFLFGDRLLFVAHGVVIAGIDMDKLQPGDMQMVNGVLNVRLPPAEIFIATLNNDKSYVYDRNTGLLTKGDQNLETTARETLEVVRGLAGMDVGSVYQVNMAARELIMVAGSGFDPRYVETSRVRPLDGRPES